MFVLPLPRSVSRRAVSPRAFDPAFDAALERLLGGSPAPAVRTPALDVVESDTAYTLRYDVPGAVREQLEITVEGRHVRLATASGDAESASPAGDAPAERVLLRERPAPRYARTVVLPADVDAGSAQARMDAGVLTLTLAKKVPSGPRKISVA